MKIERVKIGAVVPVQKYGNLQPEIEISTEDNGEDLLKAGMGLIGDFFSKYSEVGRLKENQTTPNITVTSYESIKSFNEDIVIDYQDDVHKYSVDNESWQGVTDYVSQFYKPFDSETISSVLESKWGVPQRAIKDLWEMNGELTSEFGNVVHKALEYYEKFKDYGEIISSKQGEESNYALPKHPILRSIIEGFIEINKGEIGKVVTEALVTNKEKKICGRADRIIVLDEEKMICRVKDYKINIDSEKIDKKYKVSDERFKDLPANKLTKYQLQTSVYGNLLELSGWTVVGLDVYVYEDEWKHFEFPLLQVL